MVTTIPGASSSSSSPTQQLISPPSEAITKSFSPIPPPAILRSRDPPPKEYEQATQEYEQSRPLSESIYYSTVAEETMNTNTGNGAIKSSQSSGHLRVSPQTSPPTTNSRSREALQSSSESQYNTLQEEEEGEEEEEEDEEEDNELLEYTTVVVKAVMKLNNELPKTAPADYIDYVKVILLCVHVCDGVLL